MSSFKWILLFCFLSTSVFAKAKTEPDVQALQMPLCLAAKLPASYPVLAEDQQFKIVEVPAADMDKLSLLADKTACGRFIDQSRLMYGRTRLEKKRQAALLLNKKPLKAEQEDYKIQHQKAVHAALKLVDGDAILHSLGQLSKFTNRSATTENGLMAAEWLKNEFERLSEEYGRTDTEAYFIPTGDGYKQPSLVTVLGKDLKGPAIVLGAHMDTLGQTEEERYPGADDDASGSSSLLETARSLMASEVTLERPVYFVWYAAEERGLVGSRQVIEHFQGQAIAVKAALQFDMTGYRPKPEDKTIWIFTDYTNAALNHFLKSLIKTYLNIPTAESKCGYGCSDHAAWTYYAGIPASFPFESSFEEHNPYIHSKMDAIDVLSSEHMTNFSKLGLAFAIELASKTTT